MANFKGIESLLEDAIDSLFDVLPDLILDIRLAIESCNNLKLKQAAHSLKGALSYFHADLCVFLAWKLEQLSEEGITSIAHNTSLELFMELSRLKRDLAQFKKQRFVV